MVSSFIDSQSNNSSSNTSDMSNTVDSTLQRTDLRKFQVQLAQRMKAVRDSTTAHVRQLGVMVGPMRWLITLQEAGEIVSVPSIAKVPLTRDWFIGLSNIRGNLISIVDFARFLGHPMTLINKESRI